MNKKSGLVLRIVAGMYLVYLGIRIIQQVYQEQPSNLALMVGMSIIFIVVGAGYAVISAKKVWALNKEQSENSSDDLQMVDEEEVESEEGDPETEKRDNTQ